MLLCDTHADTLYEMGVKGNARPAITAKTLKAGGVALQTLALWTGRMGNKGDVQAIVQKELDAFKSLLDSGFKQVFDPQDIKEGQTALMLSVEGGEVFEGGIHTVQEYSALGVRMAALVWNNENSLGHPAKSGSADGLTAYGLWVVREMQRLHMAVDTSHLNDQGFFDLFLKTHVPPLASHSCCRALYPHFRNLTDEQLRLLIQNGGYVGMNFYPRFLTDGDATIDDVVKHIDHICQLGGDKTVGFGSDFDGIEIAPAGLKSPADFPALLEKLKARGYSDAALEGIAGQNLLDYYARIA